MAGGDGLARDPEGRVVFVPAALPGERVAVELVERRRDYGRARLLEVLEASPARRVPPCRWVDAGCGGCGWQHLDPSEQREQKVAIVREALARTGGQRDAVVRAGPPLATTAFRTTLRLGVDGEGRLGFRAHRRHDIVAVDDCLVAHRLLGELLATRVPGAREVTLRCGARTGERLALVEPRVDADWPSDVRVGEDAHLREIVAARPFRIGARSFFQTRPDGADALVAEVHRALGETAGARLVDAYAGVGLFAGTIVDAAAVTAIEQSPSAVLDLRHNVPDARVVEGDVTRWRAEPADLVVADPARAGLGRRGVAVLAACGARRLVLVSCDPVSLARDTSLLATAGYTHHDTVVIDVFPHTPHVETVTRFDRV